MRILVQEVYVGLGSNQDSPLNHIQHAIGEFERIKDTTLVAASSLYQTKAWGIVSQDDFINAVVKLKTILSANELFDALMAMEQAHGRVRKEKWGPRTLDCDLLLYSQHQISSEILTVPHPGVTSRATVLIPLAEIAPTLVILGKPISYYLQLCDKSGVKKLSSSPEENSIL